MPATPTTSPSPSKPPSDLIRAAARKLHHGTFTDHELAEEFYGDECKSKHIRLCQDVLYSLYEAGYAQLYPDGDKGIRAEIEELGVLEDPTPQEAARRRELNVKVEPPMDLEPADQLVWKAVSRTIMPYNLRYILT